MGLSDRIKQNGNGAAATVELNGGHQGGRHGEQMAEHRVVADPYAELKTRIHHACIAKLGPQLFTTQTDEDLSDRVLRAVTEQLALDRTPLTREERRQITKEIADDILGYGPLEPFLHDDTVTEVMVNGPDAIYVERAGKIEHTAAAFLDDAHLMRIIDKIVSTALAQGTDAHDPEVLARPVHDGRPDQLRVDLAEGGAVPLRLCAREAEHPDLRRYRHR